MPLRRMFECIICHDSFASEDELNQHSLAVHGQDQGVHGKTYIFFPWEDRPWHACVDSAHLQMQKSQDI
ncbi:hypothetical protein QYF36_026071 [Acer negundo]|nr:hypothetical protein QYF36_026071 [Acer negundo]